MIEIENTTDQDIEIILSSFRKYIEERKELHLGYPYNLTTSDPNFLPNELIDLSRFSINNLGDPFIESNYGLHSRQFEIAVLDWFADLWNIPRDEYWGYIGCSGTEGNLEGILLGRETYPNGILYASEESHYSVFKAAHMFKIETIVIKSNSNDGSMDLDDFRTKLRKDQPAIVNMNIGTTMKGGIDNYECVINILQEYGLDFYIHCDGALSGIITTNLTFQKPISSISVSGHKFLGCPFPSGVIITRKKHMETLSKHIDYINSRDATIMGSRNGHSPVWMWYLIAKKGGIEGLKKDYLMCAEKAQYLAKEIQGDCNQNTVVFKNCNLSQDFIKKWQLACSNKLCHIVVMPNVEIKTLNLFIEEYKEFMLYNVSLSQSP